MIEYEQQIHLWQSQRFFSPFALLFLKLSLVAASAVVASLVIFDGIEPRFRRLNTCAKSGS